MEILPCNYVLQIENSHEILKSIDRRRLLIIPLDDKRQWFRYHHLFGEMLYARLLRKSPEIVAELYERPSAWHADHGLKEDAVNYALEGKDFSQAANLIIEIGLPSALTRRVEPTAKLVQQDSRRAVSQPSRSLVNLFYDADQCRPDTRRRQEIERAGRQGF